MKTFKLPVLLLIICLLMAATLVKAEGTSNTMLWKMMPNESLSALAAKFYPKSKTMQRAFIRETQKLNQDTQVFAVASTRYPTATQIVIPTLESLSVKGVSVRKAKRSKRKRAKKSHVASDKTSTAVSDGMKAQAQLAEKKKALDASLAEKNEGLASLKSKVSELKKQLNQAKAAPAKKPAASQTPAP